METFGSVVALILVFGVVWLPLAVALVIALSEEKERKP